MPKAKLRRDVAEHQADGATAWYSTWIGGRTLSRIDRCRLDKMEGGMTRTVYPSVHGPDTFYSIPAFCIIKHCYVKGYVAVDDKGMLVFRQVYMDERRERR